ncbi:MAG: P-loop NTPase [Acetomicrobium sp.]
MIITVASGKGGTGKTTVAVNLALTLENILSVQILDCDVEEPNVHLFLHPEFKYSEIVTLPVPAVDQGKCVGCGKCSEICAFNAIIVLGTKVVIFPELCHGCGGCSRF